MRGSAVPSLVRTAVRAGGKRLGAVWFNLLQTSLAAGLSWYLAHDVLDHPQPFFAPIAAAVSLSTSNVLRAQRAVQMMIGVTLGIGLGTVVQGMLGPGALPIAVAALVALGAAVFIGGGFIGHGMMFANQTVVSALLVLALYRGGAGPERIFDALIGGAVACGRSSGSASSPASRMRWPPTPSGRSEFRCGRWPLARSSVRPRAPLPTPRWVPRSGIGPRCWLMPRSRCGA